MLHLHFSNRFETLSALLRARLGEEAAGGDPFDAPTVIVPSAAVQRRLTLDLADAHGVCAGVEFGFLAQWLWRLMRRALPDLAEASPLSPDVLAWRVYAVLGDAEFVDTQPRLHRYLSGADEVMRLDLARRIAGLLDAYVTYRPQWLTRWQAGGLVLPADGAHAVDEAWQAALWRRLAADMRLAARHPASDFVARMDDGGQAFARRIGLPRRAHLVALPTVAPLHAALLVQLGRWMDVHLYLLNPCREYWYEVVDARRLAWLTARGRADGHEVGNRLLAAWGRQTQALVDTLLTLAADAAAVDDHHFTPHPGGGLLARWQNAVLDLQALAPGSAADVPADDRSVEVHVAHSLTRELEVLHDRLLSRFAADPALRPSDVLVVTPDLEAAAPLIDAVFGTAPPDRHLAYTITGRARSRVNGPAKALLALLDLAASRCSASDLHAVLQQPVVARRFGLDAAALDEAHAAWVASGLRWGLDAAHRAATGVPADARHTLDDALDRLFLGHAMPTPGLDGSTASAEGPLPALGLLPAGDLEGSDALLLGSLARFADALGDLHRRVAQPHPPARWSALLHDVLTRFVAPAPEELADLGELQDSLRHLADTLSRAELAAPIPLAVLRQALAQSLDDPARGGVPGGAITFSAMSPLRGLPYAVVCLVGLDGDAFPGRYRAPEFDLMAAHPQRGDRQRRHDDRNLMLDLLLAARQAVHLSHTGRSERDDSLRPPSVLLDEWLDVLVPALAVDPTNAEALKAARARLVVQHPLQPFAVEPFRPQADPRLRSHGREWCEALAARLQARPPVPAEASVEDLEERADGGDDDVEVGWAPAPAFVGAPLPPPDEAWRRVTLDQLIEFFRQPARFLLRRRLDLQLLREADELQDDEPFVPDPPAAWALAARLLPAALQGADDATLRHLATAGTDWPSGALAAPPLQRLLDTLLPFAARVRAATAAPRLPPHGGTVVLDIEGEPWLLSAGHADLRADGLVRWHPSALRPRDRLEAWLRHLWLAACPPPAWQDEPAPTRWLAFDQTLVFKPLAGPAAARAALATLLGLMRRGLCAPLPFLPKASWAFVEAGGDLRAARLAFEPGPFRRFAEGDEPAVRLAWRGSDDPIGADFAAVAQAVYGPLMDHSVVQDPAP